MALACKAAGANVAGVVALHLRPGVREHYLSGLERARPDPVGLYAEQFARGSYQPKAEQERLNALVRDVMAGGAACGRRKPPATNNRPEAQAEGSRGPARAALAARPTAARSPAEDHQLALFPRS